MELGADSWLWWWQERDREPQKLSRRSSKSVVTEQALARRSFVQAVSILFLLGRPLFPWERRVLLARGFWGPDLWH